MKRIGITTGVLIITACVVLGSLVFAQMPGPDPDALWQYITKVSPYTEWASGLTTRGCSQAVHPMALCTRSTSMTAH